MILIISFLLTSGCIKSNSTSITEKGSIINNSKPSPKVSLNTNKIKLANKNSNISVEETVNNLFFFQRHVSKLNYKGSFLFDDDVETNVKLNINLLVNTNNGSLYKLKLSTIEGIPNDRLNLGYFYVEKYKIYKINLTKKNLLKLKSGEVPNDSVIVCQNKEIRDTLTKDKSGLHQYIIVNGNRREYHSYNNNISTGFYETLIWEKNKGLINYRSGYGAERDSIDLQLSNH